VCYVHPILLILRIARGRRLSAWPLLVEFPRPEAPRLLRPLTPVPNHRSSRSVSNCEGSRPLWLTRVRDRRALVFLELTVDKRAVGTLNPS
jgi:hypothetical protein